MKMFRRFFVEKKKGAHNNKADKTSRWPFFSYPFGHFVVVAGDGSRLPLAVQSPLVTASRFSDLTFRWIRAGEDRASVF